MKVKYLGKSDPLGLLNDKEYSVVSVEGDWYRIVDETGEDYLYPPQSFEIVEYNDGSVPEYPIEEKTPAERRKADFRPDASHFAGISLRGRFAYAVLCIEAYLLELNTDASWEPLSRILWEFADGETPWDIWADHLAASLPSTFLECPSFKAFEKEGYNLLETEYDTLKPIMEEVDETASGMLEDFFEMVQICEGTNASHGIIASEKVFFDICSRLDGNHIPYPNVGEVAFLVASTSEGYGHKFNGTWVSSILELEAYGPFDFPTHCIKCGGDVTIIKEPPLMTASCDACGETAIATYFDPIDEDRSRYELLVLKTPGASLYALKTVSKMTGLNYLQIRSALAAGDLVVYEGYARGLVERAEILQHEGIAYAIQPDFPYPIPYVQE